MYCQTYFVMRMEPRNSRRHFLVQLVSNTLFSLNWHAHFCQYKIWLTSNKKKSFSPKFEVWGFIISVTICTQEKYKGACVVQWIECSSHNPKVVGLSPVSMCCVPLSKELCPACLSPPWCKMRSCEENSPKTMRMPWAFVWQLTYCRFRLCKKALPNKATS